MDNEKMTEAEFAKVVGVSARTVRRLRHDRKIQYHRASWKIYYLPEDVDAWHEMAKHEPIWRKNDLRKVS
jgi:excisionase family DNA binding protein